MSIKLGFLLLLCYGQIGMAQESAVISGKVIDRQTAEPLAGVTVAYKGSDQTAITDAEGYFKIKVLSNDKALLRITHVGYDPAEVPIQLPSIFSTGLLIKLNVPSIVNNEVVISASTRPEKITQAPAHISVISRQDLEQFAGSNVGELIAYLPAVEYTRSGVDQTNFNARGFNSAFNNKAFQIIDGRNSMNVGSAGLPLLNNATVNKEDLERIEVVLGPQSALYGPNGLNTVLNYITKDPRKHQGTTVALTAGNQHQFSGRFRQAAVINDRWAYKLTGEYAAGKEFTFYDSVRAGGGIYGPVVSIREHNVDFDFRHLRGEAQLYYKITPKADVIVSGGAAENDYFQLTTLGRNQMRDLTFSFVQARLVHPRFFINVYNSWGNLGRSYGLQPYTRDFWNRTHSTITNPLDPRYKTQGRLPPDSAEMFALRLGNMFKEQNQRSNAEAQYNHTFEKAGLSVVGGVSWQEDRPNSYGITLVDKDKRIYVTQYGGVLQVQQSLPWQLRLIAAGRVDHHSKFGTFFSPKLGLLKNLGEGSIRFTWGRAYSMPSILAQSSATGAVRYGNGEGVSYIPNGARVSDPAAVRITIPLQPEEVRTWELGYRAIIRKKLFVDINSYAGNNINFISPTQTVEGRALLVGAIPVTPLFPGIVENDTLKQASFLTFFNYGNVRIWGIDIGLNYLLNRHINLALRYSFFDSDITKENIKNDANKDSYISAEERSLNAAQNRGVVMVSFQNLLGSTLFMNIAARVVEQYDFYSGNQSGTKRGKGKWGSVDRGSNLPPLSKNFDYGPLGGFTSIDVSGGAKLNDWVTATMRITNLFNSRQVEMVGAPSIGRLFSVELKVQVPESKKQ
ncbi:MAG TPA: TonB-dependent receptor [Flavisolibacter sp.]|nr:TonB-dependent receptor [Flavisolibacter sp.]